MEYLEGLVTSSGMYVISDLREKTSITGIDRPTDTSLAETMQKILTKYIRPPSLYK